MEKELKYFAVNPFNKNQGLTVDMFIEFLIYDNKNTVEFEKIIKNEKGEDKNVHIKIYKGDEEFMVFENNEHLMNFSKTVKLNQKKFLIFDALKNLIEKKRAKNFDPPMFGFTVLGSSHGFDANGSTSGFILWINKKGIVIDPPPYSSLALRRKGIPPNLIEKIIISHCHADHDSGAFHKIIEATQVEFLSTPTIINSFLRKYSAISEIPIEGLRKLFQYRYIKIGHPTYILGARFVFSYSFHSIPSIRFEVNYKNKKFFFSSDTFYHPEKLKKIRDLGVMSEERYQSLANVDFSIYDAILHEAGIPPIHTPLSQLKTLPDEIKDKIYLYHIADKDIDPTTGLKGAKSGLENTVVIIDEKNEDNPILSNLELLCSIELINWVPFNRISEIIECFEEKTYPPDTFVIKENTIGNKFYLIKYGVVKIYSNEEGKNFQKICYRGDYFGESSIIGNGQRLANVITVSRTKLLEIDSNDFLWIFDYQNNNMNKNKLSPLQMIKNLSEIRKKKEAEFINNNKVVTKMTENQKCLINMYIIKYHVKKYEILWNKGNDTKFCFFIKTGKYEMKAPFDKVGSNFYLDEGSLVGDFPNLLKKQTTQSSVICLEEGEIFKILKEHLWEFLKQYPGFFILIQDAFVVH